jgi:hypothetical protein
VSLPDAVVFECSQGHVLGRFRQYDDHSGVEIFCSGCGKYCCIHNSVMCEMIEENEEENEEEGVELRAVAGYAD